MLLSNLDLLATAPEGVARLRELILTLAVQGKLVPQDPVDEPASVLLQKIRAEKDRLIAEGKIKRDKPMAEITEDEKPFEVPQDWEWVRLGVAAKKITDGTHHSPANFPSGDFMYLSAKNIKPWGIDLSTPTYVPRAVHEEIFARCDPELGDILYIKDGATTGVLTINTLQEPFSLLSSVGVIKPSCGLKSEYMALVMQSPFFYQAMRDGMSGVAITRVTLVKLAAARLPLPPLAEQSRIVTRVEELMRLCDALEAKGQLEATQHAQLVSTLLGTLTASATPEELADNWQRVAQHFDLLLDRPEAIDALEQTLLQLAVRGLLTLHQRDESFTAQSRDCLRTQEEGLFALPFDWEWCRLGEVAELINGDRGRNYPNKSEYVPAGVPFINTGHIDPDGSLSASRMHFLTRKKFDSLRSGKVRKGDLVYCLRGATLGKTAIVDYEEGAIASSLVIVRPSPKLDNQFLLLYLTSPAGRSFIWQHDNGSAQPNLAAGSLKKYWIPLPPLAEQFRVVTRVSVLRRLCADLRHRLKAAQVTQSHLAQALVDSTSSV